MNILELKKYLRTLGITVNGNYIKKSDLKKVISETLILSNTLDKTKLVKAAQNVYDEWDADSDSDGGDFLVGFGGICHVIADAMCDVLNEMGIECAPISASVGDQHVFVVAKMEDGVVSIDISPSVYETGSGYNWKKIPNVKFKSSDIQVDILDADPDSFEQYTGE
jgi:hypothetical protein